MVFVPMVAHRATPPSARAGDLARRLEAEIEKFDREYPGTSREDLRTAAALAIGEQGGRVPPARQALGAVVGVLAGLVGLGVVLLSKGGPPGAEGVVPVAVAVLVAAGIAAIAIARRRRE